MLGLVWWLWGLAAGMLRAALRREAPAPQVASGRPAAGVVPRRGPGAEAKVGAYSVDSYAALTRLHAPRTAGPADGASVHGSVASVSVGSREAGGSASSRGSPGSDGRSDFELAVPDLCRALERRRDQTERLQGRVLRLRMELAARDEGAEGFCRATARRANRRYLAAKAGLRWALRTLRAQRAAAERKYHDAREEVHSRLRTPLMTADTDRQHAQAQAYEAQLTLQGEAWAREKEELMQEIAALHRQHLDAQRELSAAASHSSEALAAQTAKLLASEARRRELEFLLRESEEELRSGSLQAEQRIRELQTELDRSAASLETEIQKQVEEHSQELMGIQAYTLRVEQAYEGQLESVHERHKEEVIKLEERIKVELQTNVKLAEETKQRLTELERQRLKLKADHREVVKVKEAEKIALENRVDVLTHQVESLQSVESATYSEHQKVYSLKSKLEEAEREIGIMTAELFELRKERDKTSQETERLKVAYKTKLDTAMQSAEENLSELYKRLAYAEKDRAGLRVALKETRKKERESPVSTLELGPPYSSGGTALRERPVK